MWERYKIPEQIESAQKRIENYETQISAIDAVLERGMVRRRGEDLLLSLRMIYRRLHERFMLETNRDVQNRRIIQLNEWANQSK